METPKKPWNFCETPEEKCTMNYCDENGCQNRKRNLVEPWRTMEEINEGLKKARQEFLLKNNPKNACDFILSKIEKLEADKAELLEGLEKIFKVGYKPYRNTRNEELEIIDIARNLLNKFQKHKK